MFTSILRGMARPLAVVAALAMPALMAAAPAQAQDGDTLARIQAQGKARVGVLVDFPPFGIMNDAGQPDGYDVDVANRIGELLGVEIELIPVTGPNRIPFLQSDKLDMVIASLAITKERSEQVLFSAPYSAVQSVLYARADLDIKDYADLGGHSIGVARSSPQDSVITREAPANTDIRRFDQVSAVYQAVLSGQVDGAVISVLVANEIDKQLKGKYNSKFVLYQQIMGVAMRKGDDKLAAAVNDAIAKMLADGELNEINRKWLGSDLPELTSDI